MADGARLKPYEGASADRLAAPVKNTVARGHLNEDEVYHTGRRGPKFMDIPFHPDEALIARGKERYGIYCTLCHEAAGEGKGAMTRYGFPESAALEEERLRVVPAGYIYFVIARGFGKMKSMDEQLAPADRWAVAAYVKDMQKSFPRSAGAEQDDGR